MNAYRSSIIVALLFLPLESSGQELTFGVGFEGAYDSNVFASEIDETDDYVFRVEPNVTLDDHEGELQWRLNYRPSYEYFIDVGDARGWTHLAEGSLSWQANPRTRFQLSDQFGRLRSLNRFNELVTTGVGEGAGDVTGFGFGRDEHTRNIIDARMFYELGPTRMLELTLGHYMVDFDREESVDHQTLSAVGHYTQMVSQRNQLGGGISYRRSSYDDTPGRNGSTTDFYTFFGSWVYQFDPTLELDVAVGPTWVETSDSDDIVAFLPDQPLYPLVSIEGDNRLVGATSCPREKGDLILTAECDVTGRNLTPGEAEAVRLFSTDLELMGPVPSGSDSGLTYFANVSLNKRWEQWTGTIAYRRQQSDSSGFSSSTIADIVTAFIEWTPSPRWESSFRVGLTRQTRASEGVQTVVAVVPTDLSPVLGAGFTDVAESFALRALEVDQDLSLWSLWLRLNVRYRLTERTTLFGNAIYWDQRRGGGSDFGTEYDRFRIGFGVEYRFDPIRL